MSVLIKEKTEYTPRIVMDSNKHLIDIEGDSFPENTYDFYRPMMDWINSYFSTVYNEITTVNIEINYFNSSSSQLFFDFFDILEESVKNGSKIVINWIYVAKNESTLEAGEDFCEEFEILNINMIEK